VNRIQNPGIARLGRIILFCGETGSRFAACGAASEYHDWQLPETRHDAG
jgi:hypothetical protein